MIEYCKYHVDAEKKAEDKPSKTEEEIKTWDTDFVKVDQSTLFELILVLYWHPGVKHILLASCFHTHNTGHLRLFGFMQAANYLNIKSLLDLTCLTVANMIKGDSGNHISICSSTFAILQLCSSNCKFCNFNFSSNRTFPVSHSQPRGLLLPKSCMIVTGKTPEEIRKTFNIVVSWF